MSAFAPQQPWMAGRPTYRGNVALNIIVWRSSVAGMSACVPIRSVWVSTWCAATCRRRTGLLHNVANLRLKAHVEHAVRLVQDEVPAHASVKTAVRCCWYQLRQPTYRTWRRARMPRPSMSARRPGVATSSWHPRRTSSICELISAPPYTTHGCTHERYANCRKRPHTPQRRVCPQRERKIDPMCVYASLALCACVSLCVCVCVCVCVHMDRSTVHDKLRGMGTLRASSKIWQASSRVGARISTRGQTGGAAPRPPPRGAVAAPACRWADAATGGGCRPSLSTWHSSGSRNAAVLPDPGHAHTGVRQPIAVRKQQAIAPCPAAASHRSGRTPSGRAGRGRSEWPVSARA
jgi:hypothetical protein